MFRNVPECSGMFHVPGFIDAHFFKSKHKKFEICFASSEKKSHLSARVMMRTVQLNCPIKAEIRAVDSQSDLTILL